MELLDGANTGAFGAPTPTAVRTTPRAGKAVLVSGHDLHDLAAVLDATAGTGIKVYTHGELLPAHGCPGCTATRTSRATTAGPGRTSRRSSPPSRARSS
jgi:hydroxylamine reductase